MPPTAVSEFQAALAELSARSGVAVDKLVGNLGRLSPAEARAFITDAYPELLTPYLAASGQLTAQWYAEQPVGERKPGSKLYTPEPAPLAPAAQLAVSGRWALTQSNPATAMRGSATRHVLNASRETVTFNARAEGARWVRQAKPNACGFCKMLATRSVLQFDRFQGRDLSYTAQGVARKLDRDGKKTKDYTLVVIGRGGKPRKKGGRKLGSEYHDHCRCTAVPLRDGIYEPPGYVEQWTDQYIDAFDKYGSDAAAISRALDEGRIRPDRITAATAVTQPPAAPVAPAEPEQPQAVNLDRPTDDPLPQLPVKENLDTDIEGDLAATNPNFNDGNPRNQDNCTHTVVAYELRRKGYDVEATPAPRGGGRVYNSEILNRWVDGDGRARYIQNYVSTKKKMDAVATEWGDGARGWVTMIHKGGGGHIFVVENVGGKIRYIDPQSGSANQEALLLTKRRKAGSKITYVRVDDLTPTAKVLDPDDPLVITRAEGDAKRAAEAERKADIAKREAEVARLEAKEPKLENKELLRAAESEGYGLESGAMGDFVFGVKKARILTPSEMKEYLDNLPNERRKGAEAGIEWYRNWKAAQ